MGRIGNDISGTNVASCSAVCPAGEFCDGVTKQRCPRGHYCSDSTVIPVKCPEGTFNDKLGGDNINKCVNCKAGYYCPVGSSDEGNLCTAGYFCEGGGVGRTQCTAGTYSEREGNSAEKG